VIPMKFKLIDKEKKGFARYCPTFKKLYDVLVDKFQSKKKTEVKTPETLQSQTPAIRLSQEKLRRINGIVSSYDEEAAFAFLKEEPENMYYLASLISDGDKRFGKDYTKMKFATEILGEAARKGFDISPAIPSLAFNAKYCCQEIAHFSADTLKSAAVNEQTRAETLSEIMAMLSSHDPGPGTGYCGAEALRYAATQGVDIAPYLPTLRKMFSREEGREMPAGAAAGAVAQHHMNKGEWMEVLRLLDKTNINGGVERAIGAALVEETSREKTIESMEAHCDEGMLGIIADALAKRATSQDITTYPGLLVAIFSLEDGSRIKTVVIGACVKALSESKGFMLRAMLDAFNHGVKERSQETRTSVTKEIIRFTRAEWFQEEMRKNSPAYEMLANRMAIILNEMKTAERKEAA